MIPQCRWRCHWSMVTMAAVVLVWMLWLHKPCPVVIFDDDPISHMDLRLGRWDYSRAYKLFDYAAVGDLYADLSSGHQVCLATQSSIERLHELLKIADHWSGPISVAVFVTGDELKLLRGFVIWLYRCQPDIYARLALHVAMPARRPGVQKPADFWARNCKVVPAMLHRRKSETARWRDRNPYPQNHLRNLARKNCHKPYVFLVDIDIVPSNGMAEELNRFLTSIPKCSLCAYVVPTYEVDVRAATFPANKSALMKLLKKNMAIPFHRKVFIYNQNATNFSRWESTEGIESQETHISHNVTHFELLYEPFYLAPDNVPPHDERFLGYGFTRNTQVYEMFLIGYQFRVLSPIFTISWGLQVSRPYPLRRVLQNVANREHFHSYIYELYARYRKDPLHVLKNFTNNSSDVLTKRFGKVKYSLTTSVSN